MCYTNGPSDDRCLTTTTDYTQIFIKPDVTGRCTPGFLELRLSANVSMHAYVCVRSQGY